MLEQAKTKLEMSMAAQKKEHRRELSSKDDELEDARTSTQKKVCLVFLLICSIDLFPMYERLQKYYLFFFLNR